MEGSPRWKNVWNIRIVAIESDHHIPTDVAEKLVYSSIKKVHARNDDVNVTTAADAKKDGHIIRNSDE
jgi:hypothetical protein